MGVRAGGNCYWLSSGKRCKDGSYAGRLIERERTSAELPLRSAVFHFPSLREEEAAGGVAVLQCVVCSVNETKQLRGEKGWRWRWASVSNCECV